MDRKAILLKCLHHPNWSTNSKKFLSKFQKFFSRTGKPTIKFMWNCKGLWIVKTILVNNNKVRGHTFPQHQNLLQSCSTQGCGTGVRRTYKPIEWNWKSKSKLIRLWPIDIRQKYQVCLKSSSTDGSGATGFLLLHKQI